MKKHEHAHHSDGKQRSTNEHMHQSSIKELIKRFESKERDESQKPKKVLAFLGDLKDKTFVDIGTESGYFAGILNYGSNLKRAPDPDLRSYI